MNRIAPEFEEVVVHAHTFDAQHFEPDIGERLFPGVAGCDEFGGQVRPC